MPLFRPNSWGYAPIGQEPYDTVHSFLSFMSSCGSEDEFRLRVDAIGAWRGLRQNVWFCMFERMLRSLGPDKLGPGRGEFWWFQRWSLEPGSFDGLFVPGEFPRYWRSAVEEAFRLDNFVISVDNLDRDERLSKEWIAGVRAMKSAALEYRGAVTEAYGKGIWAEPDGKIQKDYDDTWLNDLLYGRD